MQRAALLPSSLSPPTRPLPLKTFFFKIFQTFFCFKPPENAAPNARGLVPAPQGTATESGSLPALGPGAGLPPPRSSLRGTGLSPPQSLRPSQASLVRIHKDLTRPHPPAPWRAVPAFVSRWAAAWEGRGGGGPTPREAPRLFISRPSAPFSPDPASRPAASRPTGADRAPGAPGPDPQGLSPPPPFIIDHILYKSNATQFFPHYRSRGEAARPLAEGASRGRGHVAPGRKKKKKGVLFGVNLDSNSVIYQGIS